MAGEIIYHEKIFEIFNLRVNHNCSLRRHRQAESKARA